MSQTECWTKLDTSGPIWSNFHLVCPLFLIGTLEADGSPNFAPKHMASPMGWDNYFGFVCTPRHSTYQNIQRDGVFTVNSPRPDQVVLTSLAASARESDGEKPIMSALSSFPAGEIKAPCFEDSYFVLECQLLKFVEGLGDNVLILGEILAAQVHRDALRTSDGDSQEQIHQNPLLAFISPERFSPIKTSYKFPYPRDFCK